MVRRVGAIVLLAVLSAALSIATAAACSAYSSLQLERSDFVADPGGSTSTLRGFGRTRLNAERILPSRQEFVENLVSEERAGWPFRCMHCVKYGDVFFHDGSLPQGHKFWPEDKTRLVGGVALEPEPLRMILLGETTWKAIPLRPLWGGLAANSVLWACALVGLWRGPSLLRSALRRRSGRCPACGYHLEPAGAALSKSGCPECGHARDEQQTAA